MSNETLEVRARLDLSSDELVEIRVLLRTYHDTLVKLLSDPDTLLENLSVAFEEDRIQRLTKAQDLLLERARWGGQ